MNPWATVDNFEAGLCEYTGAPYAVCVSSCSAALLLALINYRDMHSRITVPRRTYISVPMAVRFAGFGITWSDEPWSGAYRLAPTNIWDCALRFTAGMYVPGQYQCISFAAAKILGMEQGGAILHDDELADAWFRKMRFDGRTPGKEVAEDDITALGYHFPMTPSVAAQGLLRLHHLPRQNADQVREYPDVSEKKVFAVSNEDIKAIRGTTR